MTNIRPAATVVVLRDNDEQLEVLLLQRSRRGFAGGAWVFPGGAVDAMRLRQRPQLHLQGAQLGVEFG